MIHLNMKQFVETQKQITFSSCVCMTLSDVKTLCNLLEDLKVYADKDEAEEIRLLSKKASSAMHICKDQQSFSNRQDLVPGQTLSIT
jgi:hypothetical protein